MTKTCSSGKGRHSSLPKAKAGAAAFARVLNQEGKIAETIYAYHCDECRGWHLTRRKSWYGRKSTLVHIAAPEHLQRWAMGDQRT